MKVRKPAVIIIVLSLIIILAVYYYLGQFLVDNPLSTAKVKTTFNQQSSILSTPIQSLGIVGNANANLQCVTDHETSWATYVTCIDAAHYPYTTNPITSYYQTNFPANAAKFDTLLKQNGWVNNRPHDAVTTIAASNPYLATNAGVGAEVPFHKNIGAVSCNLEVSFSSLFESIGPGSIDVNQFSCQQTIQLLMPHTKQQQNDI
jgi:hypothetical protein